MHYIQVIYQYRLCKDNDYLTYLMLHRQLSCLNTRQLYCSLMPKSKSHICISFSISPALVIIVFLVSFFATDNIFTVGFISRPQKYYIIHIFLQNLSHGAPSCILNHSPICSKRGVSRTFIYQSCLTAPVTKHSLPVSYTYILSLAHTGWFLW